MFSSDLVQRSTGAVQAVACPRSCGHANADRRLCFAYSAFGHYPGLREAPRACADPLHMTPQDPPQGGGTGGGPRTPPGGAPRGGPQGGEMSRFLDPSFQLPKEFFDLKKGLFWPFWPPPGPIIYIARSKSSHNVCVCVCV